MMIAMMTDEHVYLLRPMIQIQGGGLIAPSDVMLQYTMQLGETFVKHFSNLQKVSCVGHDLLQLLESIQLDQPCNSFKNAIYQITDILLSEVRKQRAEVTRKEE